MVIEHHGLGEEFAATSRKMWSGLCFEYVRDGSVTIDRSCTFFCLAAGPAAGGTEPVGRNGLTARIAANLRVTPRRKRGNICYTRRQKEKRRARWGNFVSEAAQQNFRKTLQVGKPKQQYLAD